MIELANFFIKIKTNFIKFIKEHELICLFILFFVVYNVNFRPIPSGDTVPASLLPFSILENHNLYLDQFADFYVKPYFFTIKEGHILSAYPIVTPVLIVPLYLPVYLGLKISNYPIDMFSPIFQMTVMILEKIAATIIAAFSGIFVFLSLRELVRKKVAIAGTLIFAFATNTWETSSQGLWQHGFVELLLSMMIYLVIVNEKNDQNRNIIYLGIISGFFVFNRPSDSIILIPIILYILHLKTNKILFFFGSMSISSIPFIYYNLYYMGSLFGNYSNQLSKFNLDSEILYNFLGMIISPNRGILFYTPILILSIFGFFEVSRITNKKIKTFFIVSGFAVIIQIILYSSFKIWWAGWSYGPRFLTGILPICIIFLALYLNTYTYPNKFDKKKILLFGFILVILIWSFFVQIVGAFYFPGGNWDGDPNIDEHPERLWNLEDTQIMRAFHAGLAPPMIILNIKSLTDNAYLIESRNISISGWYGINYWNNKPRRWMENNGTIRTYASEEKTVAIIFNAVSFSKPRLLEVYINNEKVFQKNINSKTVMVAVNLKKGINIIKFYSPDGCDRPINIPEMKNNDTSCLSFSFGGIEIN